MKTAFLFPGQGAQTVGMGKDLYETNDSYKKAFDSIDKSLNIDLKAICFDGVGLEKSEFIQPAIYTHSIALFKTIGQKADYYAGLSLGEYTGLAITGMMDINKGADLVNKRGAIMDNAVKDGVGGMVSIMGLIIDEVEAILGDIPDVWAANHLSEKQIVIAGNKQELEKLVPIFEEKGARAIPLNVSGPFHTPMLKRASETFKDLFNDVDLKKPTEIIYSNYTGLPYKEDSDVVDLLANQMCSRVKWHDITEKLISKGVTTFVEIGPSMVLSKMLKRRLKGMDVSISSVRDVKSLDAYLSK